MSAPTPINRQAPVIGQEYIGVAPPVAGAAIAAAAADHVHKLAASSSAITGWGRMAQFTNVYNAYSWPPVAALFSAKALLVPYPWTYEMFCGLTATQANPGIDIGLALPNGGYPYYMGAPGATGAGPCLALSLTRNSLYGLDIDGHTFGFAPGLAAPPTNGTMGHAFIQMDGAGNLWVGYNGQMAGPFSVPGNSPAFVMPETAFPQINAQSYGQQFPPQPYFFDEVRFSSALRYPTAGAGYNVPDAPFAPDAATVFLWHLDDLPFGQFMSSAGNGGQWVLSQFLTSDSSPNAIPGQFAAMDNTGQSEPDNSLAQFSGLISTVGPSSSGAAAIVESIQGVTGNFLLETPSGLILPVDNSTGAQVITMPGGGGAGDPALYLIPPVA